MIYVSEEEQKAFHGGRQKQLKLTFSDGTIITNEDIALEDMYFEQSLGDEDQFIYGQVSASHFHVRVLGVTQRFKGLDVHAEITALYDDNGEELPFTRDIGYFKVDSDVATDDRIYRDLECYDVLYGILSNDYSDWHNGLDFPMTLKQYRDAFFNHIGVVQEEIELVNDDMIIQRNFVSNNFSGQALLQSVCEINGVSGHITYNGHFKYIEFSVVDRGLFPADDLLPSDDLYPRDVGYYQVNPGEYAIGSLKYEEYQCQKITQVQIRMSEGDVGAIVGEAGNTYIIQDNPLVYGMAPSNLKQVAENVFSRLRVLYYTPSSIVTPASPWYELGDAITIIGDRNTIILCILNRRLSGITALKDEYRCRGQEYYSEPANSTNYSIQILRQKSNELIRNVEENRLAITEVQTDLQNSVTTLRSEIVQTATQIQTTVAKTQREWDTTGYTITLYGYTAPDDSAYPASDYKNKYFLNQTSGKIYGSNGYTWDVVKTCSTIQSVLQSQITQNATNIDLKVSAGNVISQLNIEINDGQKPAISMKTGRFEIDSTYFKVSKSDGWLTTTGATIGGFTIDKTSFRSNSSSDPSSKTSGVYLAPSTAVSRNITDIGSKNCLFAIGSNFGIGADGTIYANGANLRGTFYHSGTDSKGYTGSCTINGGTIDLRTNHSSHNLIHLMRDTYTLGIGVDDIYYEKTGSGKFYISADWEDIINVASHISTIRRTVTDTGHSWD